MSSEIISTNLAPTSANMDQFVRLPVQLLSCVLQQVGVVHLLKEVMTLLSIAHHVKKFSIYSQDKLWIQMFFEQLVAFRRLLDLTIISGFPGYVPGLKTLFTRQDWPTRSRLESLYFHVCGPSLSFEIIMHACPNLKSLIYENIAGLELVPHNAHFIRPDLTRLVWPVYIDDADILLDCSPHLEILQWNYRKFPGPEEWMTMGTGTLAIEKEFQKSDDVDGEGKSHLRYLRCDLPYSPIVRLLEKRGHALEVLHLLLSERGSSGASPYLRFDHALFKRLRTLAVDSNLMDVDPARHKLLTTILELCDTNVFENLIIGYFATPLDDRIFRHLTLFSHLHTLRLRNLASMKGFETYWSAMARLGNCAPLTVVELREVPVTAAQLAVIGSISTIRHIDLFSLSGTYVTTEALHKFLLKKQQHRRFQSIALDDVGAVTRDTLIEYLGKISSLKSIIMCRFTLPITIEDTEEFKRIYPAINIIYRQHWLDMTRAGFYNYDSF
ncbi:hypothetical protein BX666DRAFT_1551713 [Dichotomocladium elegans]|nr:hypothetical protein BX666DRAFT_1551713 [Dichotomocladium elegans]